MPKRENVSEREREFLWLSERERKNVIERVKERK